MGPDAGVDGGAVDADVPDADVPDAGGPLRAVKPVGLFGVLSEPLRVVDERLFALLGVLFPTEAAPLSTPWVITGSDDVVWGGGTVTGSGPELREPVDGDRVDDDTSIMLDAESETLVEVEHGGGDRTLLSGGAEGSGPAFDAPHSVAYDARSSLAYVANRPFGAACFVLEVARAGGARAELWRAAGAATCSGLSLDAANNRLLLFVNNDPTAIDLTTGAETQLADLPFGPSSPEYAALQMDSTANRLAMVSNRPVGLSFLDLATGEILVVSSADRGAGPEFVRLTDLLYFATENVAYVTDSSQANVMRVDTVTGDRAHVTAPE